MQWIKYSFYLAGMLLLVAGCNDLTGSEEDKRDLLPIKKGIEFSVQETHDQSSQTNAPVKPFIQLSMDTKDIYNCMNYRIDSKLNSTSSGQLIDIYGVQDQGVCLTALGPAQNEYALDLQPGDYDLTFSHRGNSYNYNLKITNSSLHITGDKHSFVSPKTETFWRYPENSFTYLCSSTDDTRWMCEEFEQMLNDSLDISSFTFPDYGTKPYPSVGDQYDIATYYKYPEEPVFQKAGEMLEGYSDSVVSQYEGAYLSVINWKNQGFRSWTGTGE
ncbi:hypothetical protein [Fodinibius sp.]|uniref:hypothetical protein n=1 Tax=Fodinibius sp. TaxID=1872440 RepID=UPI002ACD76C8|nr:hypothetical protein [Fodinibius sp.]MDZ7657980.1 hypothetical protein [Fodinibius sp.]